MDTIDFAQEKEENARQSALIKHKIKPEAGLGSETCKICGDTIDLKRRKAIPNCDTCLECQIICERGY
jgi:phage/conjugal plasmid C-4 type zinc finger TraR family protein